MKIKIVNLYNHIERLEISEVRQNFDNHNLKVDEKSLAKLFKKAAVNRKHSEPCNDLSLYEFCIFSKKASADFKKLMDNIKVNMLSDMKRKKTSTLVVNKMVNNANQIIPKRKKTYIKYLPSSFNPLINHLKEEEKRSDLRENFTKALNDLIHIGGSKKSLDSVLEGNQENMKQLLESHFPKEDADENIPRRIAINKSKLMQNEKIRYSQSQFGINFQNELGKVRSKIDLEIDRIIRNTQKSIQMKIKDKPRKNKLFLSENQRNVYNDRRRISHRKIPPLLRTGCAR